MLDIRIRIKKRLTSDDLRVMSYVANEVSKWVVEDKDLENVFESIFTEIHHYHYRVNIGHNIITFFDITWKENIRRK